MIKFNYYNDKIEIQFFGYFKHTLQTILQKTLIIVVIEAILLGKINHTHSLHVHLYKIIMIW